ncbi:MAG: LysM peptidoglycan-binding domain-containing protein [Marmoricola sp.]
MSTLTIPADVSANLPGAAAPTRLAPVTPITPGAASQPRPVARRAVHASGRVRLTRRGRMVLLLGFVGLVGAAMVALGPVAVATFGSGTAEPVRVVQVGPGDTLYGIAGEAAAPGKVQQMVAHIERLNALDGPELHLGQRIAVPRR